MTASLRPTGKWAKLLPTIPEGLNYSASHRSGARPAALWLAATLLELPPEAREIPSILDDRGSTWPGNRTVSLAQ